MIGASSDRWRMYCVIIDIVSASQPQINRRSSKSMFQARQGVLSEKCDSFRQLMPAARIDGSASRSRRTAR